VRPLTNLTRKSTEWQWSDECQRAFDYLKERLTIAPVLALPDPEKPCEVITDASGFGMRAVLMQEGRPIALEGRKLSDAETRYAVHEDECMASIHALNVWRCYLEGVKFTVVTDHHPNTFLLSQPKLSWRQARWSEFCRGSILIGFTGLAGQMLPIQSNSNRNKNSDHLACLRDNFG